MVVSIGFGALSSPNLAPHKSSYARYQAPETVSNFLRAR